MTALASTDPKELRPAMCEAVERLPDKDLEPVRRLLLELEARRLIDSVGEAMDEAWARGDLTEEKIAEDIREHRRKHPYRP